MKRAWISVVLLLPSMALAQNPFFGGESVQRPIWEQFKLPAKSVKVDFKNASVDAIISFFQKQSGITIVKDPALTGQLSISTAKAVPLKEAFQVLGTTLQLKGFDMQKEGNLIVIKKRNQREQGGNNGMPQFPPGFNPFQQGGDQPQNQLKYYSIKYANATQVARVVNEVFAGMMAPGGASFQMFGGGGNNNRNQQIQRMMQAMNQGRQTGSSVRASADDYSNTVVVYAPERDQRQVEQLIQAIDKDTEEPQKSMVYKLEFANATELAPVVQNVLVSNAPRGRGGIGSQNVDPMQRMQQAMRFGSAQASFGQVVADTRTNSLVVTATPENQELIKQVIADLDTEVEFESTTFVFPLSNARADDVATLISQAFGQRQGANNRGGQNNFGGQNRNQNQNRNRQPQNQNRGGLRGENLTEEDLMLQLEDDGSLQTNIAVAQGFNIFGGGQNNQNRPQTGRDAQGRVVNVRELQGQITAIPDLNTNSIIVVATPENAEVIRQILDQLDKIPEQVMIETLIVEATLDASSKLGVEWRLVQDNVFNSAGNTGTAGTDFGIQTATQPTDREGFKYTLAGGALTGVLQLLQSDQRFQVLSTPRIFTSNNVEAQINISQSVPYITSSREDPNGGFTYNYTFEDVGIILTVRPRITANGYVAMDVTQTANELQGFTSFNAPIINQRQADTTVSVRDGETIVLGGIIRNTVSSTVKKLPILGDIPILGNLFKSTSKQNVKTELLVFLTPRVVRNPEEAKKLREEAEQGMSPDTKKQMEKVKPTGTTGGSGDPTKTNNGGGKTNGG